MTDSTNDTTRENPRKVREGIVVSDKMASTLVVAVNERVSHPRYGKTVQRTKKLYVHDEKNEAKIGACACRRPVPCPSSSAGV